jgi:RimJ/RimL family protein N-acetyltransferase
VGGFLDRLGFKRAGGIRRAWLVDGEWHDDLAFDLLKPEWSSP